MNKNFEDILCILNEITSFLTITVGIGIKQD